MPIVCWLTGWARGSVRMYRKSLRATLRLCTNTGVSSARFAYWPRDISGLVIRVGRYVVGYKYMYVCVLTDGNVTLRSFLCLCKWVRIVFTALGYVPVQTRIYTIFMEKLVIWYLIFPGKHPHR